MNLSIYGIHRFWYLKCCTCKGKDDEEKRLMYSSRKVHHDLQITTIVLYSLGGVWFDETYNKPHSIQTPNPLHKHEFINGLFHNLPIYWYKYDYLTYYTIQILNRAGRLIELKKHWQTDIEEEYTIQKRNQKDHSVNRTEKRTTRIMWSKSIINWPQSTTWATANMDKSFVSLTDINSSS
jgi:hypothetical protein